MMISAFTLSVLVVLLMFAVVANMLVRTANINGVTLSVTRYFAYGSALVFILAAGFLLGSNSNFYRTEHEIARQLLQPTYLVGVQPLPSKDESMFKAYTVGTEDGLRKTLVCGEYGYSYMSEGGDGHRYVMSQGEKIARITWTAPIIYSVPPNP
jgi:hypothetical protein